MADTDGRKVWAFLGDGEMDEPESMGAIALAGREQLDNLICVVNCNLQRLDGPVRGNGKIIQELEADFRGAGWNVIKVIWGIALGPAARGRHRRRAGAASWRSASTASTRRSSRATAPTCASTSSDATRALLERVEHMTDDEIWLLNRGGHDQQKVYAAYHDGGAPHRPADGDPRQDDQGLRDGRLRRGPEDHPPGEEDDRGRAAGVPRPLRAAAHRRAGARRRVLQAARRTRPRCSTCASAARRSAAACPSAARTRRAAAGPRRSSSSSRQLEGTGEREISTTMAFVRMLAALLRDKQIGRHIVPIVPDESRTFGMEGMFRQLGIYSPVGQLYQPAGLRAADVLQGGRAGPDPRGGDHRGRLDLLVHRRRHLLQRPRRADDPVLHLLLDVRLPAGRRPRLGRRRQPHARLPARRHRRAHDAQRRGPPARGRPQPPAVLASSRTAAPTTRRSATSSR